MRKVFRAEQYKIDAVAKGKPEGIVNLSLKTWIPKCEGLTQSQIGKIGYYTEPEWFVEEEDTCKN
jgi:hypothetical protein